MRETALNLLKGFLTGLNRVFRWPERYRMARLFRLGKQTGGPSTRNPKSQPKTA